MIPVAEFAAKRSGRQDQAIDDLRPYISKALDQYGEDGWWRPILARVRALFNEILREDSGGAVRHDIRAWRKVAEQINETLPKTTEPDDYTAQTLAVHLSTAAINAAAISAAAREPEPVLMEWVTMHDDDVRRTHKDTNGQQRPPGEKFDVDGVPMTGPGDMSAPIDLWINCRCVLAPAHATTEASLAASSVTDEVHHHRVIVGLPIANDSVHDLGEEDKHVTLVDLGAPEENPDLDLDAVSAELAVIAADTAPWLSPVTAVEPLGDKGATVWRLGDDPVAGVHQALLHQKSIKDAHDAVEQFPNYVPHVTIGYDLLLSADGIDDIAGIESILFDRLALWDGENRQEFALGGVMPEIDTEPDLTADTAMAGPLPWHGVLAPEGIWSGDGRQFAPDSLRFRDLPLPLTWQKVSDDGHKGSVTIAKIESIERVGDLLRGEGHFVDTPDTDEAVSLLAEFGRFGVSVDADDATFEFDEETDRVTFTSARIASASMVAIPAFAEAFIALGTWADAEGSPMPPSDNLDVCDPDSPNYDADVCAQQQAAQPADEHDALGIAEFVSDKPWSDFTQADYSDDQWYSACVLHKNGDSRAKSDNGLPIKEPSGTLNRNGVHAAAARFNQVQAPPEAKASAARALRGAYKTLGEEPPDVLKAAGVTDQFGRGPGWITDPVPTKRIHDYWTKPGEEGYEKIGWGIGGDFNRCRALVGEKIALHSPEDTRFLNQICAQWHHDATGFWPGKAPAERIASADTPAISLVASVPLAPAEWFADPKFDRLTPITVTEDGRYFGHLCGWETCHTGFDGICVAPPQSASGYAYFLTGEVLTTAGRQAVGQVTIGGGHAAGGLRMRPAMAHYDSTSAAVADVNCGDDEFGVWLAGWVRPNATDEQVYALRAAAPSGDWREVAGNMELIAAHSVNAQGFPVPRVGVKNGTQISLVAAGGFTLDEPTIPGLDLEVLADKFEAILRERQVRREKMAALAARIRTE